MGGIVPAISLKRRKIGPRLLLMINGNRIRAFDWCQNQRHWMTLKGYYALCFKTRASFRAHHENLNEDRLNCQRRRCSPMTLDSDNKMYMRIFAAVLKIYVNFPDFVPVSLYTCLTLFRCQVQLFCLLQLLSANTAAADCKVRTSEDVASGLAKCDPQSIWNPRKNCGSFVGPIDATSSES